jgi:sterol desaturase/sphingolipid hydroxylase (fatty acid hydroxylase superfamily)
MSLSLIAVLVVVLLVVLVVAVLVLLIVLPVVIVVLVAVLIVLPVLCHLNTSLADSIIARSGKKNTLILGEKCIIVIRR